jgi:soluble lytic murein transglycosylase
VCLSLVLLWGVSVQATPGSPRGKSSQADPAELELDKLAHALKDKDTVANYQKLAAFAKKFSKSPFGSRAALVLAFHDFNRRKFSDARRWLDLARQDALLREYAIYWSAQTERAAGNNSKALNLFEKHRQDYPESVMAQQAVIGAAELALAAGDAPRALAALDAYDKTSARADLLLLRGQARQQAGQILAAAADDIAVFYQFPLSDEADVAAKRLEALRLKLGEKFPSIPLALKLSRAEALFDAKRWKEARAAYEKLRPDLNGAARELAELRIAQSRIQLNAPIGVLAQLLFDDPETEAERLLALAQLYRARKNEAEMLAAVEQITQKFPQSRGAEDALLLAGNYFWVNLNRAAAVPFYQRSMDAFPRGKNGLVAHWRLAWVAYLDRQPQAAAQFEEHLRRFPGSPFAADALYWLGRSVERAGNIPHARTFYLKLAERFPQSYFGLQARERLRELGAGPTNVSDVVNLIPPPPPPPNLDEPIPSAASGPWERAQALRSIAFDASAELELRAAYSLVNSPRLLLEAAKAALDAGRFMPGVSTARQVYPQLEARRWEDVPLDVWITAYPYAYASLIEKYSKKNGIDPMLVTALIRQETVFQPDAVSHAGAVGLMQVLPKTGRVLARKVKVRYARRKLFDPEYNLRLGTVYFRDLVNQFGSTEAALAAYNAGEDRVVVWKADRQYEEMPEFVESIPFTETREYVQIVLRNAVIYRRLYAQKNGSQP